MEWLLDHLDEATSPYPQHVTDSEIRAKLVVRFVLANEEHGDDLFRKTPKQLREDKIDEWVDGELYGIAERHAKELTAPPEDDFAERVRIATAKGQLK